MTMMYTTLVVETTGLPAGKNTPYTDTNSWRMVRPTLISVQTCMINPSGAFGVYESQSFYVTPPYWAAEEWIDVQMAREYGKPFPMVWETLKSFFEEGRTVTCFTSFHRDALCAELHRNGLERDAQHQLHATLRSLSGSPADAARAWEAQPRSGLSIPGRGTLW
jgi:hypothetical protein